ncbi:hypothetical protein [Pseudoalteromonas luteoviolacea]|uniref:hypothetical protein n=1 Tax=Pseudoalteromonas luteoviolacea TaxID=43657 RepID=UPI001B3963E6|nr:hypothetical protein [Pseudoalteromonas luteoviolacea]MBQ4836338.1 hypothetical protein [Pseudoalteromonas luteoviolacea]
MISKCFIAALLCVSAAIPYFSHANTENTIGQTYSVLSYGEDRIQTGEVLFFSLYMEGYYLSEVFARKSKTGVQLELQSLFSALDFAISYDENVSRYNGWFIDQAQRFSLDLKLREAVVGDQIVRFDTSDFAQIDGEVYFDARRVSSWFGLQFKFNYQDLKLQMSSEQQLPIERRIERQNRQFSPGTAQQSPVLPWKATPYQVWSPPLLDIQGSFNTMNLKDNVASLSLLGSQDIAFWNTAYFLSGRSGDLLSESRISASRENESGVDFGPITATQVEIGDVLGTRIGGNYRTSYARGVRVSDRPLYRQIDTQTVRISGVIQVGWDVELYQNGLMIDQRLNVQSGLYDFESIELYFGSNEFELVMYGPQGQVLQESRSYFVAGNNIAEGEGYFDTSIVDTGKTLLGDNVGMPDISGWNLLSRYDYGFSDDLSVYGGMRYGLEGQENVSQLNIGASYDVWNKGILNVDLSRDDQGARYYQFQGRTQVNQHALSFVLTDHKVRTELGQALLQHTQEFAVRAAGTLYRHNHVRLNYQNTLNWRREQAGSDFLGSSLLSVATQFGTFSNQLDYHQTNSASDHTLKGITRWQGRVRGTYGRIGLSYQLHPQKQLSDYQIQLSRILDSQFDVELDYTKSLINEDYEIGAGVNWQHDRFRLTGRFSYLQNDDWQVGLTGQFSLGYQSYSNEFFITDRRLASTGSVLVKVFLDQNNNAIFDGNDRLLEGVKIRSVQGFSQAFTDTKGVALLGNMPLNRQTDIVMDEESLPDPFYIAAHDGRSITPRKGFLAYLEYPVVHAGELEGVAYEKDLNGQEQPLAYADIELVGRNQKVVATVKSAYDGYYVFSNIRPGQYEARVKKRSTDNFRQHNTVEVALSNLGDVLLEVDLLVEQLPHYKGYIARGGEFDSLTILQAYVAIVFKRSRHLFSTKPFYVHDKKRKKYLLGYKFAKQSQQAARACLKLKQNHIACEVERISVAQ